MRIYVIIVVHPTLYRGVRVLGEDAAEAVSKIMILISVMENTYQGGSRAIARCGAKEEQKTSQEAGAHEILPYKA